MTSNHDQLFQQFFHEATVALAEGKRKETVMQDLIMRGGLSLEQAETLVTEAQRMKKKVFRQAGLKMLVTGVGLFILGVVITGLTYSMASGGGTYIITIGLFVAGVLNVLRGLYRVAVG